jgi:hypothetical protein
VSRSRSHVDKMFMSVEYDAVNRTRVAFVLADGEVASVHSSHFRHGGNNRHYPGENK